MSATMTLVFAQAAAEPDRWFYVAWAAIIFASVTFYFLPTIVAALRDHPQAAPILVLNFLLGWTFLGWVVCAAWSVASHRDDR